jgi:hypothetical protein
LAGRQLLVLQQQMREALPERPNWLEVQRQLSQSTITHQPNTNA